MSFSEVTFGTKTFIIDTSNLFRLQKKNFEFVSPSDTYPSYNGLNLLQYLFNMHADSVIFLFKNGDDKDLRRSNIDKFHASHATITEIYKENVIAYIEGHYLSMGKDANKMKNPMWRIKDPDNEDEEFLLMFCEPNVFCKLCDQSYQKILEYEREHNGGKKSAWFLHLNAYICNGKHLYIHQVIMNCHGNGKGTKHGSVDHIDRDKLNNTMKNLRIATMVEQQKNSHGIIDGTKRKRKIGAIALPKGMTQEDMPKYCVYYKDDKEKREFFRVEKHPNQGKRVGEDGIERDEFWTSSKSNKISINEKLQAAIQVINDLDQGMQPKKAPKHLPKYVTLSNFRGKDHLIFEKRDMATAKRLNMTMVLPGDYQLEDQISLLEAKVKVKYPEFEGFVFA